MNNTKLSSKGQIIIPKWLRDLYEWKPGLEFIVIDTGDGVLLKPKRPFPLSSLEEVISSLEYDGKAKSIEDMDAAIEQVVKDEWHD